MSEPFLSGSVGSASVKSDTFHVKSINLVMEAPLVQKAKQWGVSGGSYCKANEKETCHFPQGGGGSSSSSAGTAFPLSPVQQLCHMTAETLGLLLAGEVQTHLTRL